MNKKQKENINKYTFPAGDNLPRNEAWLYTHLLDHPFFIDGIKEIRNKLNIKRDGFSNWGKYYHWRSTNNEEHKEIYNETERLMNKFKIEAKLLRRAIPIITDYIVYPASINPFLLKISEENNRKFETEKALRKTPGAGMIIADEDKEINKYRFIPGNIYLEIYPETTIRDLLDIFKLIKKEKNKKKKTKITIPQQEVISKEVWNLFKKLKKTSEIISIINDKYKTEFGCENISVYKKRYKDALMKLKRF